MSKASVYIRHEDGKSLPAVCVKPPLLFQRLPKELQAAPQEIIDRAYEDEAEEWWEFTPEACVDEFLRHLFPMASAHAAGRSNGWVVVENLGDPEKWSLVKHKQWERFERALKASIVDAEKRFQEGIRKAMAHEEDVCKVATVSLIHQAHRVEMALKDLGVEVKVTYSGAREEWIAMIGSPTSARSVTGASTVSLIDAIEGAIQGYHAKQWDK